MTGPTSSILLARRGDLRAGSGVGATAAGTATAAGRQARIGWTGYLVWGTWAILLAAGLACIWAFGHDMPLAEDWQMVPALTGNEPNLAEFLWSQNNEHRLPLPRLVYLGLLLASGGDFRVGMVFNALVLAAVSAVAILVARRLRGGRLAWTDIALPLLLLHPGHWENTLWGWQIQFVLSTAAVLALVLLAVARAGTPGSGGMMLGALLLVALPLSGGNGVLYAPFAGLWLTVCCWHDWRSRRFGIADVVALVAVAAAAAICLFYVATLQPTPWNPRSPSTVATLVTAAKTAAMALGPLAPKVWPLSVPFVLGLLSYTAWVLFRGLARAPFADLPRLVGASLFLLATVVLMISIGWGRAAQVPSVGFPDRYALLAAPALLIAYLVWMVAPQRGAARIAPALLAAAAVAWLPLNAREGWSWRGWYDAGMRTVEADIAAGMPPAEVAARHREFLMHWDGEFLASAMTMLEQAGVGPYRR